MDLKCLHGDITTLPEDNTHDTIICQQVNCMGVMGAGLAAQIRRKWPNVYTEYRKRCTKDMLGTYHMVKVGPHLYVANIFGQLSYGTEKCQTNYVALACAIFQLMKDMPHCTIRIPYRIGCGLAGGNWDKVLEIIIDSAHTWNPNIEIWQFNK